MITFPASATLIAKTAQVIPLVAENIPEPGNINSIGPSTEIIFVVISFHNAAGANAQVVVHNIMAEFPAAAAQPVGPDVRSGIHQDPGTVQRGSIQENNLRVIGVCLVGFPIQNFYARCS